MPLSSAGDSDGRCVRASETSFGGLSRRAGCADFSSHGYTSALLRRAPVTRGPSGALQPRSDSHRGARAPRGRSPRARAHPARSGAGGRRLAHRGRGIPLAAVRAFGLAVFRAHRAAHDPAADCRAVDRARAAAVPTPRNTLGAAVGERRRSSSWRCGSGTCPCPTTRLSARRSSTGRCT